jgi:hypothetical protein
MGSTVTFTQMLGYSIALRTFPLLSISSFQADLPPAPRTVGLVIFKLPKEQLDQQIIKFRGALGR